MDAMNHIQPQHGYVYAVPSDSEHLFSIQPFLCVSGNGKLYFFDCTELDIDLSLDGPHVLADRLAVEGSQSGLQIQADRILSLWTQREILERIFGYLGNQLISEIDDVNTESVEISAVVMEAERILREQATPEGRVSTWLRNSKQWPGSSLNVLRNEDGTIGSTCVQICTSNPYALRSLLRWMGAPRELVIQVTGLER